MFTSLLSDERTVPRSCQQLTDWSHSSHASAFGSERATPSYSISEDDPAVVRLAALPLKSIGFDIFVARNGLEAWNQLSQVNPHLILTNVRMPHLSGPELVARVRRASAVPIVMMTAHDSGDAEVQGLKIGADDYLPKPFTHQLLITRVAAITRRVYRYNGVNSGATSPTVRRLQQEIGRNSEVIESLPRGFVRCDNCSYIGPEWRFEARDNNGNIVANCPHCHDKNITFAL